MVALYVLVVLVAVVAALVIASTVRYRNEVAKPGYVTRPQGQRRLPL